MDVLWGNRRSVFTQTSGNVWNEPALVSLIHRIVKRQNAVADKTGDFLLQYFTPHQVRHTYTTLAYEAGADEKVVSMRLSRLQERFIHICVEREKKSRIKLLIESALVK